MFGRVTSIPTMGSYEFALNKFNSTTPIRGRGTIPLGDRRSHDRYRMEKRGESIWCYYHRTPVLKIHPNNIYEINVEGWHTQTTAQVLSRLLPSGAGVCVIDGWITVRCHQGYFPVPDGGMKFTTGESGLGHLTPIDPKRQVIHKINRRAANAARRQYAAFITFAKGFLKLRQDEHGTVRFASEEFKNAGIEGRTHERTLGGWIQSDEPGDHYSAVLSLARESYWVMPVVVHESTVRRRINDFILKLHASEVLERIELPLGEVRKDPYKKWL